MFLLVFYTALIQSFQLNIWSHVFLNIFGIFFVILDLGTIELLNFFVLERLQDTVDKIVVVQLLEIDLNNMQI